MESFNPMHAQSFPCTHRTRPPLSNAMTLSPSESTHPQLYYAWTLYPVRVVDDDGVSRGEIDAQPSGSGAQQEYHAVGSFLELGHRFLAFSEAHAPIQTSPVKTTQVQVVLQNVEHASEL